MKTKNTFDLVAILTKTKIMFGVPEKHTAQCTAQEYVMIPKRHP